MNRSFAVNRLLKVTQRKTTRTIIESKEEAKKIIEQSKVEADKIRATADAEYRERRTEAQRQENRLISKTENLERKLEEFRHYYNEHRVHQSLDGGTPAERSGRPPPSRAVLDCYACLFQMPIAA